MKDHSEIALDILLELKPFFIEHIDYQVPQEDGSIETVNTVFGDKMLEKIAKILNKNE